MPLRLVRKQLTRTQPVQRTGRKQHNANQYQCQQRQCGTQATPCVLRIQ
jgi:hypothetical protein